MADDWFSKNMREQELPGVIARAIERLKGQYGQFEDVHRDSDRYLVVLERAEPPVHIALDPQGRITGLLFQSATPTTGTLASFVEDIASLPAGRPA